MENQLYFLIPLTQWGSRFVLFALVALSIWSVAVMIEVYRCLRKAGSQLESRFVRQWIEKDQWLELKSWANVHSSLQAQMIQNLFSCTEHKTQSDPQWLDREMRSFLTERKLHLEAGLTTLATLGSNAPFIGLFGTVLGIIQAFGALGTQPGSATSGVMIGISEALITTAVGLFVAIPAVIAYNYLSKQLKNLMTHCESIKDLYVARRHGQS